MAKIKYGQLKSNPHYDGDSGKFFEHDTLTRPVDGSVAAPSDTTLLKFLGVENNKEKPRIYYPEENVHEQGFYPLDGRDGRKPFIGTSDREPDCELTYTNNEEFAFAVATRLLMKYRLATKMNHTEQDIKKIFIDPEKQRYDLPDRFLAMDILLCAEYCRNDFEGYLSKNKNLINHLIKASGIKHFELGKGNMKEKINALERRKEEIMIFNETGNTGKIHEELYQKLKPESLTFNFRKEPKSKYILDKQAFYIVQFLRDFYGIRGKDNFDRRDLVNKIRTNEKPLPIDLVSKALALEEFDKMKWIKGYFPFRTYEVIMKHCEKAFNAACDAVDKMYKEKHGKESPKGMRQKILRDELKALKNKRFKV